MGKTQPVKNQEFLQTYETVKELKKEKVIPEELFAFVEPVVNDAGEKEFTALQTKFIDSAQKRMNYYKDIAQELEKAGADAKKKYLIRLKKSLAEKKVLAVMSWQEVNPKSLYSTNSSKSLKTKAFILT